MTLYFKNYDFNFSLDENISVSPLKGDDNLELYNRIKANKEYLKEWCPWIDNLENLEDINLFLNSYLYLNCKNLYWRIGIYDNQNLIGWVSVFNFNWSKKKCYLGYWIDQRYQRKGYITRTSDLLIFLMKKFFDIKIFYILCNKYNYPSQKVAENLNAKKLKYKKLLNLILYSIK